MNTAQPPVIPLWPEGAVGSEAWEQVEAETVYSDWDMPMVHNVTQPSLTVYPANKPNGAGVIVAPGGAFHFLAIEHEGRQVAAWLNGIGVTTFILKYRVLRTGAEPWKDASEFTSNRVSKEAEVRALLAMTQADANQAVRIVRQRGAEWGVEADKIGMMGFSAGGKVTAQAALSYDGETRPDFAAPIYAAVFEEPEAPADAPPLFMVCAQDDEMASRASLMLYTAWKKVRRPVEMHVYASGGHGFGMRKQGLACDTWTARFEDWLRGLGVG